MVFIFWQGEFFAKSRDRARFGLIFSNGILGYLMFGYVFRLVNKEGVYFWETQAIDNYKNWGHSAEPKQATPPVGSGRHESTVEQHSQKISCCIALLEQTRQ